MRFLAALSPFLCSLIKGNYNRCCPMQLLTSFFIHFNLEKDCSPLQLDADMYMLSVMWTFGKRCSFVFSFSSNTMFSSVFVGCLSLCSWPHALLKWAENCNSSEGKHSSKSFRYFSFNKFSALWTWRHLFLVTFCWKNKCTYPGFLYMLSNDAWELKTACQ